MRLGSILTLLLATGLAILAGVLAQRYLERQRTVQPESVSPVKPRTTKIVVAAEPLRFGTMLSSSNLREIDWPAEAVPAEAFSSVQELLSGSERRAAISLIEINEPVLRKKVTGPGQRATLSTMIESGMRAFTIRVNDVFGVAGFVLPGDRVDVLLTRTEVARGEERADQPYTEVLLQNVRVLAIDQLADDRMDKPAVAKSVTLEVDLAASQRLALASTVGSLTLTLRPIGQAATVSAGRLTAAGLGQSTREPVVATTLRTSGAVTVTRGTKRAEYSVPAETALVKAAAR